jgi:hypothetical protein
MGVLVTSAQSWDRFLGELSPRRQRILQLADASGPPADDLIDELSEQLIGADEELVHWSQHLNVKLRSLARTLVETGREPSTPRRA